MSPKKKSVKKNAAKSLTPKQMLFVYEYIKDFNGKQAAIRAGYAPRSAEMQASRLLSNDKVSVFLEKAKLDRIDEVKTDATWILKRLREELDADIADIYDDNNNLLPVKEWPEIFRKGLTIGVDVTTFCGDYPGQITKVRVPDKIRRLELIGKHVQVKAFEEVHHHEASDSIIEAMMKARERAKSLRR